MTEKKMGFKSGDKVRVKGHEGHAEVVSIESTGEGQQRVKLFFPEAKEMVTKFYPFTEIERVPEILERVKALNFDLGYKYDLFMDAMRFSLAYKYDPLFSLSTTKIDLVPHQIEAVYNVINSYKLRYLIADDPGLGKTIIVGMLLRELEARKRIENVLFVVPAPLQSQWWKEMLNKFGEKFAVYDSKFIRNLPISPIENPWEKHNRIITSIDYAKQIDVRETMAEVDWDLVVFDEAHKLSAYRSGRDVKKTKRYRLGEALAEKTDGLFLLTATPHKGDSYAFYAILKLLDPNYFPAPEFVDRRKLKEVMIRRLKENVTKLDGGPLFKPREVATLPVKYTSPETSLYEDVTRYVSTGYNIAKKKKRRNVGFAMVILQKRMVSSIYSIKKSLQNRKKKLESLLKRGEAFEELSAKEQKEIEYYFRNPEMVTDKKKETLEEKLETLTAAETPEELKTEIEMIKKLIRKAEMIKVDSKARKLKKFVEKTLAEDPEEKILIFTEYRDTLTYLLEKIFTEEKYDSAVIHGRMSMSKRDNQEEKFKKKKTNLMIATDAAGEGLNLQFCHIMINYELPWNPTKIEQRMGRLHRYGQERKVNIFNLMVRKTREGQIFEKLLAKLNTIRQEMGERTFDVMGDFLSAINIHELVMKILSEREVDVKILKNIDDAMEKNKVETFEKIEKESLIKSSLNLEPIKDLVKTSQEQCIDERDLLRFVKIFFDQNKGKISQVSDGVYKLDIPPNICDDEGIKPIYKRATFSREKSQSIKKPTEFIALGHPLMGKMMFLIKRDEWGGRVALKTSSEGKLGAIFSYVSKIRDGTGKIVEEKMHNLFLTPNNEVKEITPKAVWDLNNQKDPSNYLKQSSKITQKFEEMAKISQERSWEKSKELVGEVKKKRKNYLEITRRDVTNWYTKQIKKAEQQLKEAEEKALVDEKYAITVEGAKHRLKERKEKLGEILRNLDEEEKIFPDSPELVSVAIVLPQKEGIAETKKRKEVQEIEEKSMEIAINYEKERGREPFDVSERYEGYDIKSKGEDETRYIEVKGLGGEGVVESTTNEWYKAKKLSDCYWLYIVEHALNDEKRKLNIIRNPYEKFKEEDVLEVVKIKLETNNWRKSIDNQITPI